MIGEETWSTRFGRSLDVHNTYLIEKGRSYVDYRSSLDEFVRRQGRMAQFMKKTEVEPELWSCALSALGRHAMWHEVSASLMWPVKECESPIEVPMYFALAIVAREHSEVLICGGHEYRPWSGNSNETCLSIEPQAVIGKYRVDFLLRSRSVYGEIDQATGRTIPEKAIPIEVQVIVECDGHDFHERTKEQAAYDRQKDRLLQEMGFKVFRFTGSEIWSDVFKCAREAVESLTNEEQRQLLAYRPLAEAKTSNRND